MAFSRKLRIAGPFVFRHKFRFIDFIVVVVATLFVLYLALTFDIFANAPGQTPAAEALEFDELVAVIAVLLAGLVWAVRRLLRERREIARRTAVEREIRILAFHDPLTGLPNRRQFSDALKAAAGSPPKSGGCHGILMLDLNGFKRINDVFGHAAGDEVLIHVSARISKAVRDGDMVARLGGDEFAVLATHLSGPEAATGLALRIIEELRTPMPATGHEHVIASAIGIALTPQDGNVPAELLRKADIALYRAKEQSNSAMRFFEPQMDIHVRERDRLERELRAAIEAGEILTFYQPLVDLKSGKVRAFEALPKWHHPQSGEIGAERFIPIAEDSGLIAGLTDRLLMRACSDAITWPIEISLAVTIPPILLRDPGLAPRVMGALHASGLSPQRLELQITESALVRDMDSAQAALGQLRETGVRIALDDFGTGYSSLYHLRNFKLDTIKIDRTFVAAMATDRDSDTIVRALVGLGLGLGLEVVAEGVESEEQRRMLVDHGCEQAQGFFYGGAVSATDALALVGQVPHEDSL